MFLLVGGCLGEGKGLFGGSLSRYSGLFRGVAGLVLQISYNDLFRPFMSAQ